MKKVTERHVEELAKHVPTGEPGECWEAVGCYKSGGNRGSEKGTAKWPVIYVDGDHCYISHLALAVAMGLESIPKGYKVKRLCGNKNCGNPDHMLLCSPWQFRNVQLK